MIKQFFINLWRKICDFWLWLRSKIKQILIVAGIISIAFAAGDSVKDEVSKTKLTEKYDASIQIKAKYTLDNASLVKTDVKNAELDLYKGEPKDEVKVTLGDKDKTEFVPNIELKRWNEVSFKIKPKGLDKVATKDKTLSFEGDKIKFGTPKMDFEMYETTEGEGGYKYIWYLNEKPTSNIVEFEIETSGLDFFYQPPLTQEYKNGYSEEFQKEIVVSETQVKDLDGNVLVERPENVVGSYAVYHSTKGGMNDINGKDYKVGKAFHIYRPHIIDAKGKETWGILHIENGIYSVEIPQDFLDKAVYPIKSNDDLGYTTSGTSTHNLANSSSDTSSMWGYKQTLSVAGTLDSMTASLKHSSVGTTNVDTFLALYREDSGGVGTHALVASVESLNLAIGYTKSWKTITAASEVLSADDYILAGLGNGEDETYDRMQVMYDNTNDVNEYTESSTGAGSYATRKAENPWTEEKTTSADKISIYATYTPAAEGTVAPTPKIIIIE